MADTGRFKDRLICLSPEHKEKMMTIAEQLKQIGFEEGRKERFEKNFEKGAAKARLSVTRNLLEMNFPVEKIVEATGLSAAEIETLRPH